MSRDQLPQCCRATKTIQFTFNCEVLRCFGDSFKQSWMDERQSQPWKHLMPLTLGRLGLTTKPLSMKYLKGLTSKSYSSGTFLTSPLTD